MGHLDDAVGAGRDGIDESTLEIVGEELRGRIGRLKGESEGRLDISELLLDVGNEAVELHTDILLMAHGDGADGRGLARDGVMKIAAVELGNTEAAPLLRQSDEAGQELVCIGASEVDVAS